MPALQRAYAGIATGFLGIENPLDHGVVEIGLVLEMPINGATRHAGFARDVRQRRAGYPLALKNPFSSIQNAIAGFLGFFFGFPRHGRPPGDAELFTYIQERMYYQLS